MKIQILILLIFFISSSIFAQRVIFTNPINEASLSSVQKLDPSLSDTYISTKYYSQPFFELDDDLEINLPNNRILKASPIKNYRYSNKSESFVYKIENEPNSEFVLSRSGNTITGMYTSFENEKIIFHQLSDNVFAVSVVNEASLINKDSSIDYILSESSLSLKVNANICLQTTPICPNTTIDVLIVYTTAARIAWGGVAQSNSFVATAMTNFNNALVNSGVTNTNINIVYSGEISYTESGNLNTDLLRLRNNNDGYMDAVHSLRTTYGADLCALITSTPTSTCGLGYLNTNATNYSADNAFSATLYNCVVSNYSLAHEMGHNMGLNHDWYVNTSSLPCEHHHGYVNQVAINLGSSSTSSQRWRTIMSYNNECNNAGFSCTRINRWSNPTKSHNSNPTGIAIGNSEPSDEAFAFTRFACVVSQFMPTSNLGNFEIKHKEIKDFTLFPNPAKEEINVWIKNDENYTFKVINVLGQIVVSTSNKTINLRGLPSGDYFLGIYNDKNILIKSKKFIVK